MTNASLPQDRTSQAESILNQKLLNARKELLDLSARNRLLNTPRSGKNARTIEIVNETAADVFRLLVTEERALTFTPGRAAVAGGVTTGDGEGESDEIAELAQPDEETGGGDEVLARHTDLKLQTRLTSTGLQKRLFEMCSDAVLLEQEQGVNILYLAIGMLKWIDPSHASNVRYAPLMLVPVSLERGTAAERFKLKWRHEELSSNLSLEAYLDLIHGMKLPVFETGEDCDPVGYAKAVAETVALKEGWQVLPDDIVLGFFSFAKFLMYRDLDVECWPEEAPLTANPLLRSLLGEGFSEPPSLIDEDAPVDPYIAPVDMLHVADCDSSQMLAVHEVRQGRNLVIQGPPGTGKSQTIANIIASAVADGKTVLFVAEKMVALDVVKRRLDRSGVGDACLELHSNKTNKRVLLQELKRTWELGSPRATLPEGLNQSLENERDVLNLHGNALHAEHGISRLTPFQVVGELTSRLQHGGPSVDFELADAPNWPPNDRERRRHLIEELASRIGEIGLPRQHPWYGIGLTGMLPTDVDRLIRRIAGLKREFDTLVLDGDRLATQLHLPAVQSLSSLDTLLERAELVAEAPLLSQAALSCDAWDGAATEIMALLTRGAEHGALQRRLSGSLRADRMDTPVGEDRETLATLRNPGSWDEEAFVRLRRLEEVLAELEEQAARLQARLGISEPALTIAQVRRLAGTGLAIAQAPDASPEAFASTVWNYGVDQAGELAEAAADLESIRRSVGNSVLPAAWKTDLDAARGVLARHGEGLLRHLSSEWRAADKQVRGLLTDPKLPLAQVLTLLDALRQARHARSLLEQEDAFARQAFGPHWRGDRSSAAPLKAMVSWMRSLSGLGPEARMIAARLPDRTQFGPLASRTEQLLNEFTAIYDAIPAISAPSSAERRVLGEMPLGEMRGLLQPLVAAEARTRAIFSTLPQKLVERLALLSELETLQDLRTQLRQGDDLGARCFGERWARLDSDWLSLHTAAAWITGNGELRLVAAALAALPERGTPTLRAQRSIAERQTWLAGFSELVRDMKIGVSSATSHPAVEGSDLDAAGQMPVNALAERMQRWLDHPEALSKWMAFRECEDRVKGLSLSPLTERLFDGRIAAEAAGRAFSLAYYEALLREMLRQAPSLARFDGSAHARVVDRFVALDRDRIAASAVEVVQAHHRRIPIGGGVGPIGILRGEIARRSRHLPIRQLMQKAAPVIQALKPVLMMSPLSVAQFLPPGKLSFDLLVMDEASQIQPVDALGAIARCRQIVVVGDERQLPPTRFFAKMTSNPDEDQDEDEDDNTTAVADVESVLGLCMARGLPQRMLRWHYRSRHESLIAVSNSEFYESKLSIFPSPVLPGAGMGLRFHHIRNGIFYPGKTAAPGPASGKGASAHQAANPIEAQAVAEAVLRHARDDPKQSIGVATFSVAQKALIAERIEALRRLHPETEGFFHAHPAEPFFVKNLENVQGDERDVILLSVGYGRDPRGNFAMRFGPLANEGGERRLNVLISRAKSRCEVYASITDDEIDTERARSRGVFALKLFLHFARTGRLDMTKSAGPSEQKSVFMTHLATALRERGHLVHEQVGLSGCFIDLAVLSPDLPGRYVLGIECDGPGYRRARSARDRDRLRKSVLEDHDWILHRVWSLDWLHRPLEQMALLEAAIERACAQLKESKPEERVDQAPLELITIEREDATAMGLQAASAGERAGRAYLEASEARPSPLELHETPTRILAELVERIVKVEGPLHVDEVVVRVRGTWGLQRAGQRIQGAVDRAVDAAVRAGKVERKGDFLQVPGAPVVPRDRSKVSSLGLRRPEMLAPEEIDAAILSVLRDSFGATQDELIQACARIFGYAATSGQLRSTLVNRMAALAQNGTILARGDLFVVA